MKSLFFWFIFNTVKSNGVWEVFKTAKKSRVQGWGSRGSFFTGGGGVGGGGWETQKQFGKIIDKLDGFKSRYI